MTETETPYITHKRLVIVLSDRRPVSILESEWPVVSKWRHVEGRGMMSSILVRQNADGRHLVHGGVSRPGKDVGAGFLVAAGDDVTRAIRRVVGILPVLDPGAAVQSLMEQLPAEPI